MNTQSEALQLADELELNMLAVANGQMKLTKFPIEPVFKSAAELRRLHEVNQELLEALKLALPDLKGYWRMKVDDAIAKATGEQA